MHGRDVATGIIVVSIVDSTESSIRFARSLASVNTDLMILSSNMVSNAPLEFPFLDFLEVSAYHAVATRATF